jgi:macrolide-specific efflux system membrane fusion protein
LKLILFIILYSSIFLSACQKKIVQPVKGDVVEAVYGLGTVDSEEKFVSKSAITSYVRKFFVTEGDDVVKGQKLYVTDQGAMIYSPFPGRVSNIPVSINENLFPQTPILSVYNLKKLYLTVSLEQQAIMRIRPNLMAEISFEFFRNKKLQGKITSIYPADNQFMAKVELTKWPEGVLPGMTADVAIEIGKKNNVTLVPTRAIVNGHIIFKRDGRKNKVPVEVGLIDLDNAEILSPELKPTDEIILP